MQPLQRMCSVVYTTSKQKDRSCTGLLTIGLQQSAARRPSFRLMVCSRLLKMTARVVTTERVTRMPELHEALSENPDRFRILTGERPTGRLHLGHLLGSSLERVRLKNRGVETLVVIADYQVITDRDTAGQVKEHVRQGVIDYLVAGIDPQRTTIFTHSSVPALNQLLLPFLSLVSYGDLRRNPAVKSELAASDRALSGLLLTYPVHQAADILFCKGNLVPVGKDNLPHVEINRTIARCINERYAAIFPEPVAMLTTMPELPGLDGR